MQITTYGKNIDVTPSLKEYAVEKVSRLERFFDKKNLEAKITFEVEKERHIVEVTVYLNGIIIRGEEETGDMYASIDGVIEKVERQIHKYKTKINRKMIEEQQEYEEEYRKKRTKEIYDNKVEEDEFEPEIVRTKSFAMKPMNVEEAVMQMDLLDHDFYVFSNAKTEEINVVYKRKDGNYGLIEPAFS